MYTARGEITETAVDKCLPLCRNQYQRGQARIQLHAVSDRRRLICARTWGLGSRQTAHLSLSPISSLDWVLVATLITVPLAFCRTACSRQRAIDMKPGGAARWRHLLFDNATSTSFLERHKAGYRIASNRALPEKQNYGGK